MGLEDIYIQQKRPGFTNVVERITKDTSEVDYDESSA